MILALQTIVSRNISPFHAVVLSITEVHGGHVWNVVPAEAGFQGTVRFFDQDDERLVHRRFVAEVEHTAEAYGIAADVDWDCIQVPLVGDEELSEAVAATCLLRGAQAIHPSMAGEDFVEFSGCGPVWCSRSSARTGNQGAPTGTVRTSSAWTARSGRR